MTDDTPDNGADRRITEAIAFMRRISENDSTNRERAKFWRSFRWGNQWPAEIQNSRMLEQRPCITVNKTDAFCRQVSNALRKQRPRIKVDPANQKAERKTADVLKGMIRHIETSRAGAGPAYDAGADCALTEGEGYWRIMRDYVSDDSFEQELFMLPIENTSTVFFDDNCIMPDGSDNEQTLIVSDMPRASFKSEYPDKDDGSGFVSSDTVDAAWLTKETIRVAEYYYIKREQLKLYQIDGKGIWADDERIKGRDVSQFTSRSSVRKTVKWCKITAMEVLEERTEPGRYIPIVRVRGETAWVEGKKLRAGLVKNAEGPAMMGNFWKTAMTESVALAPKAKWIMAEGQDEDHTNEWATANTSAKQYLVYKSTDVGGKPAPPPQRLQPEPPPEGAMAMAQAVDQDLTTVLGIVDPAMRIGGNVSGKALQSERLQSDNSTFNFSDELTSAVGFGGRILLDLMPYVYYEPGRVVRIVGDDGKSSTTTINRDPTGEPDEILHDISIGAYEVVMDAGPGYETNRQEARDAMGPLFQGNEDLMKVAGDVYFRSMDYQGAEVIADRLAAANPLAQIDETSPVPPQAQMQIKSMQQQLQQAGQQIQALEGLLKSRMDVEQVKQDGATKRELVKTTAQVHMNEQDNRAWDKDIDTKSLTALSVAEINQFGKIITQDKDHAHDKEQFERVAEHEDNQLSKQTKKEAV